MHRSRPPSSKGGASWLAARVPGGGPRASASGSKPAPTKANPVAGARDTPATSATIKPVAGSARGRPSLPTSKPRPGSSSSAGVPAPSQGEESLSPPLLPDTPPEDRLSRTITPLLYLILSHLSVSELCCLCRVSRLLFSVAAGTDHDVLWKKRFIKALAARTARATAAHDPKPVLAPDFLTPTGLSFVGRAYFARQVDAASQQQQQLAPSSRLPVANPYRHAILMWTRDRRASKFAHFCAVRARNLQHAGLTKRTVEELRMGLQMHLFVGSTASGSASARGKKTLWQRDVRSYMHDNTVVAAWHTQDGLTVRKLQGVQLVGHSGAVMRELELTDVVSAQEREWHVLRNAANEHSITLLEWRLKDSTPARAASASSSASSASASSFLPDDSAASADSPFAPNAAARARSTAAARAATAAAFAASLQGRGGGANKEIGLPIPGLHCAIQLGVWGPVSSSRGAADHEIAFIWLSLPHSALLARLPRPSMALKMAPRRWEVRSDDLDSMHGLGGYTFNVALRSTKRTICAWFFKDLSFEVVEPRSRREKPTEARLLLPNVQRLIPPWNKLPGLPWNTGLFAGRFQHFCILDFVLRTSPGEGDRPVWVGSATVELHQMQPDADGRGVNLHMDELAAQAKRYSASHATKDVGRISFQLSHSPGITTAEEIGVNGQSISPRGGGVGEDVGATRFVALWVHLDLAFIDQRFGTHYGSVGAATPAHAVEQSASRHMTDAQRTEHQRQQLDLRHQQDQERPIASRHALAANGIRAPPAGAPRHAPQFTVVADPPTAPAGRAGSGARPARRSAPRAEWQDTVEKKDDEEDGFKF